MKIFQTPSYDRFCLFEMERKSKDFRGMDDNVAYKNKQIDNVEISNCIFRKNCASVPEERSAIPLQTEQSSAGLLVAIIYSTIPARKFKTICLGCHSA